MRHLPRILPRKSRNLRVLFLLAISLHFIAPLTAQSDLEKELFDYMNLEREREGLKALSWNESLYKVALAHSNDMAQMGVVSHEGSNGSKTTERIRNSGVFSSGLAENVARDTNVVAAHTALMESLYHRRNILNPEYTDTAVGVTEKGKYLYVTEVFIKKIDSFSLADARQMILTEMNLYRKNHGLGPLIPAMTLNDLAQSHVDFQERVSSLGPPLIMSVMAHHSKGALRASVYTTSSISNFPEDVLKSLDLKIQSVGIGFKRIQGDLCKSGCFLITLMFGPESS